MPFRIEVIDAEQKVQQDLRFPGQVQDTETGLVYNNAREYAPKLGRYLQADPLGLNSGSLNPYAYAHNNPVNLTDPTGEFVPLGAMIAAVVESTPVVIESLCPESSFVAPALIRIQLV